MSPREKLSLALFILFVLSLYGLEIALLVRWLLRRARPGSKRRILSTKPAIVLHVLAVAGILCFLYGYFIEPGWIDVTTTTIRTAKLTGTRVRIVQISDLHCDRAPRNEERAVRIINALRPDIVVATGDFLNDIAALPRLRETLTRLDAPLGKFAVKGNFEIRNWSAVEMFEGTGFRLLEREAVTVRKGDEAIDIAGLSFGRSQGHRALLAGLGEGQFHILLFHTPDLIEDIGGLSVDLYLCGHTHGGQVALPFYGALITFSRFGKKYESGLYRRDDTILYVNRGLGLEPGPAPQVRFCARPEIAVFDIVPER